MVEDLAHRYRSQRPRTPHDRVQRARRPPTTSPNRSRCAHDGAAIANLGSALFSSTICGFGLRAVLVIGAVAALPPNAIFAIDDSPAKPTKSNRGADAADSASKHRDDEAAPTAGINLAIDASVIAIDIDIDIRGSVKLVTDQNGAVETSLRLHTHGDGLLNALPVAVAVDASPS